MKADAVLVEHHERLRDLLRQMEATTADEVLRRRRLRRTFADEISVAQARLRLEPATLERLP